MTDPVPPPLPPVRTPIPCRPPTLVRRRRCHRGIEPAHGCQLGRPLHIRRKVKVRPQQELVVGGWQAGEGGRSGQLGSLLVGFYDADELRFAGKVGTGFTGAELTRLGGLLAGVAADECPFEPPPPRPVSRLAHWVRPELVAEVTFAEWTPTGTLRHPSYLATREDKDPRDVVRES